MPPLKTLTSRDLYTVGWISALPLERAAATAMLDEKHEKPLDFNQPHSDSNSYTWGRIGDHNVVIASLAAGKYGTTSAAATALPMLVSFPQIRIGLLVGIGAGIPRPDKGRDIRLGDVAVSQPRGNSAGVIQYDLFKAKAGNQREGVAFLNRPPEVLLHALANIQAEHELEPPKLLEYIDEAMGRYSKLAKQGYVHQGFENDRLFKTSDPNEETQRRPRDSTDPEIHYGIIASGNTLFKDAAYRDAILEDIGDECICFEMEAAGLMNNFPCLVIRGICDYADSHKNDRWQRYAAITAAAYAKEILAFVPCQGLQRTQKAIDIMDDISENVGAIYSLATDTRAMVENIGLDNRSLRIEKWLCPPDPSINLNEAQKKRQIGTGSWFLDGEPFKKWKTGQCQHLWLHGIPGCGKTVLCAAIIEDLNQQTDLSHIVLDFFFNFTDADKQSLDKLVRSLVAQLYSKCDKSREELERLFSSCENGHKQPTFESLSTTFMQMAKYAGKIQIVLDALDECLTRRDLLSWLKSLACSGYTGLHLLSTSRKEEDIESELKQWLHQGNIVSIQQAGVNHDIRLYVHRRLRNERGFERWRSEPSVYDEIETQLMEKSDGMFRWAACQLDILQDCLDLRMLRKSLNSLPKTLEETYARILASIDRSYRHYAIRVLQFLTYSNRPLTIQEAIDSIVVEPDGNPTFNAKLRMPETREIIRLCSSLVSLVTRYDNLRGEPIMELQLAHFSVEQYLKSGQIKETFPEELTKVGEMFQNGLNEITAKGLITRVCLAYLSQMDELCPIDKIDEEFPLAEYCANYWMDHARPVETEKIVQESVLSFFLECRGGYVVWEWLFERGISGWTHKRLPEPIQTPVYYASLAGLRHTVEILLNKGVDVNAQGGFYSNALQAASQNGYLEIVQLLLEKGADINAPGDNGNALQAASHNGHLEIVQLLLEKGVDINAQGGFYNNALQAASQNGHLNIVQLLLEKGADINAQGGCYDNALQAASRNGYREVVQLLIEKGADINAQGGYYDNTLQAASYSGHLEIVQLLLEKGADINAQGGYYDNALQAASQNGYLEIVQLLLEKGADINAPGGCYNNALQAASYSGHLKIVQLLLEKGADINARGGYYDNALHAASYSGHLKILQLLLDKGADINTQGHNGNALQAASQNGHLEIVQLLLEKGSDINAQGGYYDNALHAASHNGYLEIVQLLLEKGADVNAQGDDGDALHAASQNGHLEIVQLLLEKGADINSQGDDGDALQAASQNGHLKIVQLLLEKGADGDALQAASKVRHLKIVQLLLEKGADINAQEDNSLQDASQNGYLEIVQLLIEKGVDINAQGDNSLQAASTKGYLEIVQLLLEKGADGNALQAASYSGHLKIVQLLLEKGADINAQGGCYDNALQAASYSGHLEIVQLLLEKGADINAQGDNGNVLQAASKGGHLEIVQLLLEKGVDINAQGDSSLQAASYRGHLDIVQLLLEKGADINAQGNHSLQAASRNGHLEIVQLLLEKGADINAQGRFYGNALYTASYIGHLKIVQLLLEKGADINAQGDNGNVLQAASKGGHLEIVQLLLEKGVDINAQGGYYNNALQAASQNGYLEIVQLLLKKGADINALGDSSSALQAASENGHLDIVQLLIEKGADINAQGGYYNNAIQGASHSGHLEIVQLLLEKGADINAQEGYYSNSLQAALEGGHLEVVQLLLEKGADINARGDNGNALQAASKAGHLEIVQLLLEKGVDSEEKIINPKRTEEKMSQ
ncbi:hypothetical protein TMatcc_005729 [Talaromyces marneffei ATCC 18224]